LRQHDDLGDVFGEVQIHGEDEDEDEATVMLNGDSDDEDAEWEMPGHDGLHAKEVRCHIAPPDNARLHALPCLMLFT
jgi:hypothetical protein